MSQPLHEEVRIKDHRLVHIWFSITLEQAALCFPVKKQRLPPRVYYCINERLLHKCPVCSKSDTYQSSRTELLVKFG